MPSLNTYIEAERSSKYKGAEFKKKWERIVILHAKKALKSWKATGPVRIHYKFYEKDRRRDYDNIQGLAHKIIQDALVKGKWLPNDGQKWVMPPESEFFIDKANPRVEVEIEEVNGDGEKAKSDNQRLRSRACNAERGCVRRC